MVIGANFFLYLIVYWLTLPPLYVGRDHLSFLEVSGLFCRVYFIFDGKPVSKQCRPRSNATICCVLPGSALFAYDPFTGFKIRRRYELTHLKKGTKKGYTLIIGYKTYRGGAVVVLFETIPKS